MPISVAVGGNTFECSLGMTPFGSPSLMHWSPAQIHALRACSLLAIPPPPERMPPQGGFPTDLSELNLSDWAALVQDVTAGLLVLPPNLGRDMGLPSVALLQLLEASTGVGFCCYCCRPGLWCTCTGASPPVPPMSWSQVVEQASGCGVSTSSGGMTTPNTSVAGCLDMWRLCQASPLQISPVGVCPLQRPPYPGDYPQLCKAYLISGGPYKLGPLQKGRLGHSSHRVQGVWSNGLRHSPHWCCTPLRWCHLSVSHHLGSWHHHTSRQYSHQASPLGGESLLTPP